MGVCPHLPGSKAMMMCLEDAVSILNKWKEDSARVLILGQLSMRAGLWAVHEGGVDWNLALRAKVSQVSICEGTYSSKRGVVVFEADGGELSLAMDACAFTYDQNCELPEFVKSGLSTQSCASCLFIFLPSNETFVIYEMHRV
jgi:hypothetical protein